MLRHLCERNALSWMHLTPRITFESQSSSSSRSPTQPVQQQWWRWWSSSGPPSPHIISRVAELLMATVRFALVGVCYISEEHALLSGPPHHIITRLTSRVSKDQVIKWGFVINIRHYQMIEYILCKFRCVLLRYQCCRGLKPNKHLQGHIDAFSNTDIHEKCTVYYPLHSLHS